MNAGDWLARWDRFLFAPEPVTTIAVCRILLGLLVLAWAGLLWPHLDAFFGPDALVSAATVRQNAGARLNVFSWLDLAWLWPAYWLLVVSAVAVTFGLFTRIASIVVFVLLCSFGMTNPAILNGGDRALRIFSFFLIFSAAGKAISLDRLWRLARGREDGATPPEHAPWAQRLIQIEVSIIYLMTYVWKAASPVWQEGTALYFSTQSEGFYRFHVPVLFDYLGPLKLMTWGVLAIEFAIGVLIWFRPLRPYVLAAGVLLHLVIEYTMNIPLFQWVMIAMMTSFVPPEAYARAAERLRGFVWRIAGPPTPVYFSGPNVFAARVMAIVIALDVLGRMAACDSGRAGRWLELPGGLEPERLADELFLVKVRGRWRGGFDALRWASCRLPLMWPVTWLLYLPGAGWMGGLVIKHAVGADGIPTSGTPERRPLADDARCSPK